MSCSGQHGRVALLVTQPLLGGSVVWACSGRALAPPCTACSPTDSMRQTQALTFQGNINNSAKTFSISYMCAPCPSAKPATLGMVPCASFMLPHPVLNGWLLRPSLQPTRTMLRCLICCHSHLSSSVASFLSLAVDRHVHSVQVPGVHITLMPAQWQARVRTVAWSLGGARHRCKFHL